MSLKEARVELDKLYKKPSTQDVQDDIDYYKWMISQLKKGVKLL